MHRTHSGIFLRSFRLHSPRYACETIAKICSLWDGLATALISQTGSKDGNMNKSKAEIVREYGPFPDVERVNGVTYDGHQVWFASGDKLNALDPVSGKMLRSIDVAAHAGTAFDGQHLFQIAEDRIHKIDPKTGRVLATIPAPGGGGSGLTWAEGTLWVGQYRDRKIHQVDPRTGAILRTIESNRFVTGVTWVEGELWHGTWEGDESDLRRIDPQTGEVLQQLGMPPGVGVSGLESDGGNQFFCGGGTSGKVRAVRRPGQGSAKRSRSKSPTLRASSRTLLLHKNEAHVLNRCIHPAGVRNCNASVGHVTHCLTWK
jgi:glutamine cyclotransferase